MTLEDRLVAIKDSIASDKILLVKLKELLPVYQEFELFEQHFLSVRIIEKNLHLKEQLVSNPESLLQIFSTLRYFLESLINSELLKKEPTYIYKLFYSIYLHQINKNENIIKRLKMKLSSLRFMRREKTI